MAHEQNGPKVKPTGGRPANNTTSSSMNRQSGVSNKTPSSTPSGVSLSSNNMGTIQQESNLLQNKDAAQTYMKERDVFLQTGQVTGSYRPENDASLRNIGNNTYVDNKAYEDTLLNAYKNNMDTMGSKSNQEIQQQVNQLYQGTGIQASYANGQTPSNSGYLINTEAIQNAHGLDSHGRDIDTRDVKTYTPQQPQTPTPSQNSTTENQSSANYSAKIREDNGPKVREDNGPKTRNSGNTIPTKSNTNQGSSNYHGTLHTENIKDDNIVLETPSGAPTGFVPVRGSNKEGMVFSEQPAPIDKSERYTAQNLTTPSNVGHSIGKVEIKTGNFRTQGEDYTPHNFTTPSNTGNSIQRVEIKTSNGERVISPAKTKEEAKVRDTSARVKDDQKGKLSADDVSKITKKGSSSTTIAKANGKGGNIASGASKTDKIVESVKASSGQIEKDMLKLAEGKKASTGVKGAVAKVAKPVAKASVVVGEIKHYGGNLIDPEKDTAQGMAQNIADGIAQKGAKKINNVYQKHRKTTKVKHKIKKEAKRKQKEITKKMVKEGVKKKTAKKAAKSTVQVATKAATKTATKAVAATATKTIGTAITSAISAAAAPLAIVAGLLFACAFMVFAIGVSAGGAGGAIASKFVSQIISVLDGSWTPQAQLLGYLESVNYAQMIADDTCQTLGASFEESAKNDAQKHYSSKDNKVQLYPMDADGNVTSTTPLYDWYCDVGEGKIGYVWMREQCDNVTIKDGTGNATASNANKLYTVGGHLDTISDEVYFYEPIEDNRLCITPNANIVPIMSMAHDRYIGEWNYENYMNAEAYVFYMYALSHNTAHYDPPTGTNETENTYSFTYEDSHTDATLWNSGFNWNTAWNKSTGTLTRPTLNLVAGTYSNSDCTNVYVHGYQKSDFFGDNSQALLDAAKNAGRKFLNWLDGFTGTDLATVINQTGVYTITYNRDSNGVPTSESGSIYAIDTNVLKLTSGVPTIRNMVNGVENGICGNSFYAAANDTPTQDDTSPTCGIVAHTHTASEYSKTCSYEAAHCTHSHSESCCSKTGIHIIHDYDCGHDSGCNSSNCDEWDSGHSHTGTLSDDNDSIGNSTITSGGCTFQLNCTKQVHTHKNWTSVSNPGCCNTVVICKGHCGGHIAPSVNVAVTYTFEGLAYQDALAFKDPDTNANFMSWAEFHNNDKFKPRATVAKWSKEVSKECASFFDCLPNGAKSAICWAGTQILDWSLDAYKWWNGLWHDSTDEASFDVPATMTTSAVTTVGDEMKFKGWFEEGSQTMLNKRAMRELYDFYGTPEDMYAQGVELWADFDVIFDIGYGESLTPQQISDIIAAIEAAGYNLSNGRREVIQDGLEHCGYYTYACDSRSHFNGMYANAGPSECTGFVSGVYMRALGSKCGFWNDVNPSFTSDTGESGAGSGQGSGGISRNYGWNTGGSYGSVHYQYSEYKYQGGTRPMGNNTGSKYPGDVICMSKNASSGGGHAMIYLGEFTDPESGETGHYVVDCSSTAGGSSYRKVTASYLSNYPAVYSPFGKAMN